MSKHTPGPWKLFIFDRREKKDHPKNTNCYYAVASHEGQPLSLPTQNAANARLIASAPELVAALKAVCEQLREYDPDNPEVQKGWKLLARLEEY